MYSVIISSTLLFSFCLVSAPLNFFFFLLLSFLDLVDDAKFQSVKSGTWHEHKYPGVRCDIPAHVYQTSFEPNTQWTEEFASGTEIKEYWRHISRKYGIYDLLKLSHQVENIEWDEEKNQWKVKVTDLKEKRTSVYTADFVLTAIGRFNAWKMPEYPGMAEFEGLVRHTSDWDPEFDVMGKKVAVIGNGASGIQVVTNIQPKVARLDHYARSKTWVSASFSGDATSTIPKPFSKELRKSFENPATYTTWRKELEDKYWRGFEGFLKGSDANREFRNTITKFMKEHSSKKPEILDSIIPDFSPHCRRLTPGPGYLEAITSENVEYIQTGIKKFTKTGIETIDGQHREVDAIFCATGANVDMVQPFPIKAHGKELSSLWKPGGDPGFPYTYLGAATPGFPNLLFVFGPNTGRAGSIPLSIESQVTFYAKILRKASREGIKSMAPSPQAADDFVEYCNAMFNTTVLSENCSSWYNGGKQGGFVHGLWPGSGAHWGIVLSEPRWEDWEYEYMGDSGNRLMWYLGRGSSKIEKDPLIDMTPYIKDPPAINLRDLHDDWWKRP